MPGFYSPGEYDVAGFVVGVVPRARIVDGRTVKAGDALIALPSSGLHTNGYSLARRIAFDVLGLTVGSYVPELEESVGDALLRTHRTYLPAVGPLLGSGRIKGMAHITGGGITENLPSTLPDGLGFALDRASWTIPPLFRWLQQAGAVPETEMFRAFNMGVGLVLVCAADEAASVQADLVAAGEPAWLLGHVTRPGAQA
jgi:phosphoribosylformylglycinamidine cyclo-ligase